MDKYIKYSIRTTLVITALIGLNVSTALCAAGIYPDLADKSGPNPRPKSYPSAFDIFAPPVGRITPISSAPIVYDVTKIAAPGESVALIGCNITADTRFFVYGQTSPVNGAVIDGVVQKLDPETKAVVTLPDLSHKIAPWSTYFLWLTNGSGTSRPVLINRTEAWWLGPDKIVAGETTSLHGVNLAHDNGKASSWIYIKPKVGSGQWVTVNSVNPYCVSFTVPKGIKKGNYEVWVHNGHGGEYGWSKSPNDLQVYGGPGWTTKQFNVKRYGARGNGTTDETNAINRAIAAAAASPRSTVYFPAGTYKIMGALTMSSHMRFLGEGMSNTVIKGVGSINIMVLARNLDTVEIKDLKIDSGEIIDPGVAFERVGCVDFFGSSNIWLTNVELYSTKNKEFQVTKAGVGFFDEGSPFGVGWDWNFTNNPNGGLPKHGFAKGSYIYLTGCKITGFTEGGNMASIKQVFIDNCDFYGRYKEEAVISGFNLCDLSITNCTGQDFDPLDYDNPNSTNTAWTNRFLSQATGGQKYVDGGYKVGVSNQYVANNTADGGPHRNALDKNKGEMILFESPHGAIVGKPVSTSTKEITFEHAITTEYQQGYIVINKGKGEGQVRKIAGYNSGTKTVTIDRAWDMIPDTLTSYCTIYVGYNHVAVYSNKIQGHDNWKTFGTASSVTSMYSSTTEGFIFDSNKATQVGGGFCYNSHWWPSNSECATVMNVMFFNNSITDSGCGFVFINRDYDKTGTGNDKLTSFGNIVRNNTCNNGTGITIKSDYDCGINIFEGNKVTNGTGISFDTRWSALKTQRGIFINNKFSGNGVAVNFKNNLVYDVELVNNSYSGYSTIYRSFHPGNILEVSKRRLELTSHGNVANDSLLVINAGTSSLKWSASSNMEWLTLSKVSGSNPDESTTSVNITCDPKGLADGVYLGTITFTAGSQSKTTIVKFIKLNN